MKSWRKSGSWVAGLLMILFTAGPVLADDKVVNEDWSTTLKVKLALLEKLGTDSLRVDVDTEDGHARRRDEEARATREERRG